MSAGCPARLKAAVSKIRDLHERCNSNRKSHEGDGTALRAIFGEQPGKSREQVNIVGAVNPNHNGPKQEFVDRPISAPQLLPAT